MSRLQAQLVEEGIKREEFTAQFGHINRPVGALMDGKWWTVHAGKVYQQVQDGPYNAVNAIHDYALMFFGDGMLSAEDAKPRLERHPALIWLGDHLAGSAYANGTMDGNGAAWYRFAWDLHTIRDNAKLTADLRKKLLDPRKFQSGRYELKVAAICAAAGFELQFEDERDPDSKHPEFVGKDKFTGAKIAIEAKCRHRYGVMGFTDDPASTYDGGVKVKRLVKKAYGKRPALPFYVFIDTNLPPRDAENLSLWEAELVNTIEEIAASGKHDPCPANAVLFTNDPSHYVGAGKIGEEADMLWMRAFNVPAPQHAHPSLDMVDRLMKAHLQRVYPPADFSTSP
jgi:hypothetical protein